MAYIGESGEPFDPEEAERRLPSAPGVYGELVDGYRERWQAGAFGEFGTAQLVAGFVVVRDRWDVIEGVPHRTIIETKDVRLAREAARAPRSSSRGRSATASSSST